MSKDTYTIDVGSVTRIEGHGSIKVSVRNGKIDELVLSVTEANRFFESLTKGMLPHEIPWIVSRICGICCVGHQLAATKAVESALQLDVSLQTVRLRKLLNESQIMQSHLLHVYFLAIPDYVGVPSILPLVKTHPDAVRRALSLKQLTNEFTRLIGGRTLHPMANTLRGWRKLPDLAELDKLRLRLKEVIPDVEASLEMLATLSVPDYERETEYVSLKHPTEYALYDGAIYSSDTGERVSAKEYRAVTNEYTVPYSTAKFSKWHRESYMVGALARVNNNFDQLHPAAQEAAEKLGLYPTCYNPYMNNAAQMVEIIHCLYSSLLGLEEVLEVGLKQENTGYVAKAGCGVGVIEAPRGLLIHEYGFDDQGQCDHADAVIPTSQNINNIERDMKAFSPSMVSSMSQSEVTLHLEMLLRAYDPCISCSVHMVDVEFQS